MSTFVFLLSLLLGLSTFLGLIAPKLFIKLTKQPSRKRVLLMLGVPSFVLFLVFGKLYESPLEEASKNPEGTLELRLANSRLESVPEGVFDLTNLRSLDLSGNSITALPASLVELNSLKSIDLSKNPIDSIPSWLGNLESLEEIDLTNTALTYLPSGIGHINILYEGTPLWRIDHPESIPVEESSNTASESKDEDHTESLGDFALRSLLGKDYGHKREFGQGKVYYDDPVTKEQADKIGEALTTLGLFSDDKAVSVLLDWDEDVYILKMVVDEDKALDEEVVQGFQTIRQLIQATALPEEILHIHLTDGKFETIKTID